MGAPQRLFAFLNMFAMDTLFTQLYTRYRLLLLKIACDILHNPEESQDIVQDAFVKLWNRRCLLKPVGLKYLLCVTVRRLSSDCLNKKLNRQRIDQQVAMGVVEIISDQSPDDFVHKALNNIHGDRSRQIMEMLYVEGKEAPEVAEQLGIKEQSVRNVNCESVRTLRKKYAGTGNK